MKIDLQKLGLTKESTFEEIQTAINGVEAFSAEEVKASNDTAAAGARKAALAANKKPGTLTEEEMIEFKSYKKNKLISSLKANEKLSKFSDVDAELIIKAEKLDEITDEEQLAEAIDSSVEKYKSKLTKKEVQIPPANTGLFDDHDEEDDGIKADKTSVELQEAFG